MSEPAPERPTPDQLTIPLQEVEPSDPTAETVAISEAGEGAEQKSLRPPRGFWPLGAISVVLAVIMLILEAVAIVLANTQKPAPATTLAVILNWATILPLLLGVLAMIFGKQRKLGFAGVLMSLVANPFLLTQLMNLFSSR
ncbi:MAG: hypothetical protein KF772_04945 [Cryobacterium sp.]|nr:hypothetical protein [Cryobacterium sp.]MCO5295154.1 hypothetical protein [Homoserinimonas sp.]